MKIFHRLKGRVHDLPWQGVQLTTGRTAHEDSPHLLSVIIGHFYSSQICSLCGKHKFGVQLFEPVLPGHRYLSHQHTIHQGFRDSRANLCTPVPAPIELSSATLRFPGKLRVPGQLFRRRREDGDTSRSDALIASGPAALPSTNPLWVKVMLSQLPAA